MKVKAENDNEQLWWVDEKDKVLGFENRKKVHDQGLIHREIAILIYDAQKRVLFQKRSMKKRSNPGLWSTSVAGHVEYGTEPMDEAAREAEEEVGLKGVELEYWGKELMETEDERYFAYWFGAEVAGDFEFRLNNEEVDEVKFLSPDGLGSLMSKDVKFNNLFVERVKWFWEGEFRDQLAKEDER